MRFRPLRDCVLIRRIGSEAKAGGIIIPDTAREKPVEGEVVAVGPGTRDANCARNPLDLKTGDRGLFGRGRGMRSSSMAKTS